MKNLLLPAFSLFALFANAQTEVSPYRPGLTENGITYFLPTTRLHVTVKASRTTYIPGEFCKYSEHFLRLKNVPQTTYDIWEIQDIKLTAFGEADKTKAYSIKLKPKTSAPLVGMSPDGRLLSVNAEAPAIPPLTQASVTKEKTTELNATDYKTEEILSAGSTTKMAELTANEIYDIRENRSLLMKGQADFMPKDGEQLKLMIKGLDTQEAALLQLFSGRTEKETHVFTFDYTPERDVSSDLLFRFSRFLGPVDKDDLAGEPFYINIKDLESLPEQVDVPGKKAEKEPVDLRYVVPGRIAVSISTGSRNLATATFSAAQFGRIETLGGELFNKKNTTHVLLYPETGGIMKINAEQP